MYPLFTEIMEDLALVRAMEEGEKKFYRIKVGDYRLGVKIEDDETVTCIRFLHR